MLLLGLGGMAAGWGDRCRAQEFEVTLAASMDRWMYPHNASPGTRPVAPVFGTLGDESGVDSRHGQFLVGFDLMGQVSTNLGPSRYLIRECRLALTLSRNDAYTLDPTADPVASYLPAEDPGWVADADAGRPVELFGAGFRNGYSAETFAEDSPFGSASVGQRNAYAAGYSVTGEWVDVGNNAGKTNLLYPVFEVAPFAVGTVEGMTGGEVVPAGALMNFQVNLGDPLVLGYVQAGCDSGRLRWMVTSLHVSGFGGSPTWAEFHTRDSVLGDPPRLVLRGTAIRSEDTDLDGLPDDWERHYFGALGKTGADDTDEDGHTEAREYEAGTDPTDGTRALVLSVVRGGVEEPVRVWFRPAGSRRYRLESSVDLREWTALTGATLSHDLGRGWAWFEVGREAAGGNRFLRIQAESTKAGEP